ncbi:carboxypeptidase family protein [Larkinella arboricola]|uniref:Carboxypeptidase family protein n=1 Tax=Larkinella arboricola TaxID=643671 RepID=A0A327X103_LARAB|nr:TonB-dependent receptor [Larkinella arboricola]RAK00008.1 carboxypeptidase family protein [Larkinella arboricola]
MKYLYGLLLSTGILTTAFSQTPFTQTVRGRILDKESKYPLSNVTVQLLEGNTSGTLTDSLGRYRLPNVPVGRRTIRISRIGYREALLNNIIVDAGRETILDVELEESITELNTITVKAQRTGDARNEMAVVSARQFTVDEADRYAGSRGEPARMASNFAGVQGADDSRNDIVIRGNSPSGVLWRVEGVTIPNPNHFAIAGTTGGPVSIISNKMLANSDFFTGAFPAEFGNGIAGVFDLRLRNGNNEKHQRMLQFGFLGTEGALEGPISRKTGSSYFVTYRYANLWLFNKAGIDIGTQAVPTYQDAAFRLNFPLKNNARIALWGFGGTSTIDLLISKQEVSDRNIFGQNDRDQYYTSRMGVVGATYEKPFSRQTFLKTTLAVSGNAQDANHDYLFFQYDANGLPVVENNRYKILSKASILDYRFSEIKTSLAASVNHKFSSRSILKAGLNTDVLFFNFLDSARVVTTFPTAPAQLGPWQYRWDSRQTALLVQPYVQWRVNLSDRLTLSAGLTSLYFSLNTNSFSPIEPRAGLAWDLGNRQKLSVAAGLHSQIQPTYVYFYGDDLRNPTKNRQLLNQAVGLTKSWHYVTSYDRLLGRNLRLKLEAYYQKLFNVPVEEQRSSFSILNTGSGFTRVFPDKLVNTGTGRNYGAELTLEKFFSDGYYFLVTGSLFDAKYRGSDGVLRNTDFNGRYAFNTVFAKEFTFRKTSLNVGAKFTAVGGRWYGPVDEARSQATQEIIYQSAGRNTLQFPDYRRFDLKVDYKINRNRLTHTIAVDFVNILGIQNILTLSYAPQPDGTFIKREYQLGFLPVFYYRVDF